MLEMSDVVRHFTNSGMESIMRSRCLQWGRALGGTSADRDALRENLTPKLLMRALTIVVSFMAISSRLKLS